jgi:hypothetical protein
MACRELQPLIKKSPSFQGVMSATRCTDCYALHFRVTQHPLWPTRVRAVRYPENSRSQPPLLLGPVFPGCHRKRVITSP